MNSRFDKFWIGLPLGLLLPLVIVYSVFLYRFDNYTFEEFIHFLKTMRVFSKLISLCVIPNLGLFFIFIWTNNNLSAKGVLGSTIIWTFVTIIIRFLV